MTGAFPLPRPAPPDGPPFVFRTGPFIVVEDPSERLHLIAKIEDGAKLRILEFERTDG